MKLQTTTPSATPPPLLLDVHWPHKIWRTDRQQVTTAGIGDCRSKESMPTPVGVGSYAAIAYGKRWYVARVTDVQDGIFGVSYTTPCRGKWKWGRTDEGGSGGE